MHPAVISEENSDLSEAASALRQLLARVVKNYGGDSILLSGGLDTSIIAELASKTNPHLQAFTVLLKDFPSPDRHYSKLVSSKLGIGQDLIEASLDDVESALPEVIKVLRSFDPMEIRNSTAIFLGLQRAKSEGYSRVLTGDAADELFAGYNFATKLPKMEALPKLHHLWEVMHFSSIPLAESFEIKTLLPFLDDEVRKFATSELPFEFLVRTKDDEIFGKFILRIAFEDLLPSEIVWRKKTPIEYGSGTTVLSQIYSGKIDGSEFEEKKRRYLETDHVRLRDPEQLHYYEIYRKEFGVITSDQTRRICPACTSNLPERANFCTTCGEFPV